jgi:transcription-repair coupling factor (superfamily II helicase)
MPNVYEAVVDHLAALRRAGKKVVLASYSIGARERLKGLLGDHGLKSAVLADSWQEALGVGGTTRPVALAVVPLDHGFSTSEVSLLTEQDMLGDRLVRRRKRKKGAEAFINELATLSPGDLVVHADHGIGRFEGLTQIPVGKSPHDCIAVEYAGGDKLYVPVENIDVLSRYGSESEGVGLDRLGGEAWQRRKARMKERIREIAGELIKTAAQRALPPRRVARAGHRLCRLRGSLPLRGDGGPGPRHQRRNRRSRGGAGRWIGSSAAMSGSAKTEVALRAAFVAAMAGLQVALVCPTTLLARQHYNNFMERFRGFPIEIGRLSRSCPPPRRRSPRSGSRTASSTSSSAPTQFWPRVSSSRSWGWYRRRGAALRRPPTRSG